jgi:hypothetical protein
MKTSHILNFSDWSLTEQDLGLSGFPPIKGITADTTAVSMQGRGYKTGNEDYINQLRTLSPEEMRKRAEFEASVVAFAVSFVPVLGPLASAALISTQAVEAAKRGDYKKAGKDAFFAALTLAIPGLNVLKNLSRLGSTGVKALQTKLDRGEKMFTSLELMGIEEIKRNPELVAKGIEKAISAKGISTKGLNLEAAAKSAF